MKQKRDITPYMNSATIGVNASLSLLKIYKRIRTIDPAHKPCSRYQARLQSHQAERRFKLHIVR